MKKSFWIALSLIIISTILGLYYAITIQTLIPTHWNAAGEIDGYGSSYMLLLFPAISLGTFLLLYFLPKLDPKGQNIKASGPMLALIIIFMPAFMLAIQLFTIFTVKGVAFIDINVFMPILLGILFVLLGVYMPKVKPNYMMGIRTPWTLANEKVWEITHQKAGKWFIISGIIFFIGVFLPQPLGIFVPIAFMLIVVIGVTIFSYIIFKRITNTSDKEE